MAEPAKRRGARDTASPVGGPDAERGAQGHVCTVAFCPICLAVTAVQPLKPDAVEHLLNAGREFLLDEFSIADAYLATVLNWTRAVPIDLAKWPNVKAYHGRIRKRPSIARAWDEELALYTEEQARSKAA